MWLGPVILVLVCIAAWGTIQFMGQPDGPAWIQAIWSVVAAFLAVLAPIWHTTITANSEYRRNKKLLAELVAAGECLCNAVVKSGAIADHSAPFYDLFNFAKWQTARDSIAAFPVTVLKTSDELGDLMTVRRVMDQCFEWVKRTNSGSLTPAGAQNYIKELMEHSEPEFRRLKDS